MFKIKKLGEYYYLHLNFILLFEYYYLLLCHVFEKFLKTSLEYYCLDPSHYFSSPGLSWDAMLKMTKIKLELISNIDMRLFIEEGMRGGISYIAKRYSNIDENKSIMYSDANNLCGWEMIQSLPVSNFKFLTQNKILLVKTVK